MRRFASGIGNRLGRRPFTLANSVGEEQGVNTRIQHLEDAARLAMGSFLVEERPPASRAPYVVRRIAIIAAAVAVAAIVALAYLA